jgi:hypothetical protein
MTSGAVRSPSLASSDLLYNTRLCGALVNAQLEALAELLGDLGAIDEVLVSAQLEALAELLGGLGAVGLMGSS